MVAHFPRFLSVTAAIGVVAFAAASLSFNEVVIAAAKPNIVVVMVDDQGWSGTSVQMDPNIPFSKSDYYETPNLESLAAQGMRFPNAYSGSAMCSPSKAALLTGKSPAQLHMTDVIDAAVFPDSAHYAVGYSGRDLTPPLPFLMLNEYQTVAEWLKAESPEYGTSLIRKDHVGSYATHYGFDMYDYFLTGYAPQGEDPKQVFSTANRANAYMEEQVAADNPFFMIVSPSAIHMPFEATAEATTHFQQKPQGQRHKSIQIAAMTADLDTMLGQVLDKIENLGIEDNTYVIYTSDNGGSAAPRNNEPLLSAKGALWEGGIRVPFIVKGPGIAPNSVSHVPVVGTDLFATVSELAGITAPLDPMLESASLVPVLHNAGQLPEGMQMQRAFGQNGELFFHLPQYTDVATPMSAVRDGDYKLVKVYGQNGGADQIFLFNIAQNPTESPIASAAANLASQMPQKTTELLGKLETWLVGVDASMPFRDADPVELHWKANQPGEYPSLWRSETRVRDLRRESWNVIPNNPLPAPDSPATVAEVVTTSPHQPGLGKKAFEFDGDDRMESPFFRVSNPIAGPGLDVDNSASLEMWVKLDALNRNHILFESGSAAQGMSLTVGDGDGDGVFDEIRLRVVGNGQALQATAELDGFANPVNDFVQVAAVINDSDDARFLDLYVNGARFAHVPGVTGAGGKLDWDGFDNAGLGGIGGSGLGGNAGAGALPFSGGLKGEIASMRFQNFALEPVQVREQYNAMLLPVTHGIASFGGGVGSLGARPSSVALGAAEAAAARIFHERTDKLDQSLALDAMAVAGGSVSVTAPAVAGTLVAGSEFSSYLLKFDPVGSAAGIVSATGVIHFKQDILGFVLGDALLSATDGVLGAIGNYGLTSDRGWQPSGTDFLEVSPDLRTLTFRLSTLGTEMVQMRVLTAVASPADFNGDGNVDGSDLAIWKTAFGINASADADGDGDSDGADFLVWQRSLSPTGAAAVNTATAQPVPEPSTYAMLAIALAGICAMRRTRPLHNIPCNDR